MPFGQITRRNLPWQKSRKICIYQKFVVPLRSKLFLGVISIMVLSGSRSDTRPFFLCFITHFWAKNTKKCKKMQKNCKKICIYQKFVVILHRLSKRKDTKHQLENQKQTEK